MSYYSEAEKLYEQELYEEAYELYKRGAELKDYKCYFGIAVLCYNEEIDEYDAAPEMNLYDAAKQLFDMYIPKIKKMAKAGDSEASLIMYLWNSEGFYGGRDHSTAFEWLKMAADQGCVWAQNKIARVYLLGGCAELCDDCQTDCYAYQPKDIRKAAHYFLLSANKGNASSQYWLGFLHHKYDEIGIDLQTAIKWYTLAEENGDERASEKLCELKQYADTEMFETKPPLKSCLVAAGQGDADAQWHLANLHFQEEDDEEGLKWAHLSAKGGNADAQFFLCCRHLSGAGVLKSLDSAIHWCALAAEQGHNEAKKSLDKLQYAKLCQNVNPAAGYSQDDIALLERVSEKDEVGARVLLNNARLTRARALSEKTNLSSLSEAISLYSALLQSEPTFEIIVNKELPILYYRTAMLYENVLQDVSKALDYYIMADEKGYHRAKFNVAMLLYDSDSNIKDYSKAIYNFKKCTELGIEEGKSHYYLGNCFYWGLGVPVDFEIAKKHYISAYEYGFNCDYAIDTVSSELGERIGESSMQKYAESIKKLNLSDEKLAIRINKDLISDFGSTWEKLSDNSRRSLATAMETYVHIYCKGPHKYGNYDFSGVVGGMCKALEIELAQYLYSGYIKYLKENNVSPNSFVGKRTFLKRISATEYAYDEKTSNFTLGAIYLTIGEGKKSGENLDNSMIDYLDLVFKNDAFESTNRRLEIANYILSLADKVHTIAEQYRNAAAHSEVIKCKRAEICGDHIIKVQKLLCKFVEKFKQ